MTQRQCGVCGALLADAAKFCATCGAPVGVPVSGAPTGPPPAPPMGPPPGPRPQSANRTAVTLAAAGLVVVLIIVVLVIATSDKKSSTTSTPTTSTPATSASTKPSTSSQTTSTGHTTSTTSTTVRSSTIPGGLALDKSCASSQYGYSLLYPTTWTAELSFPGWDCGLFDPEPFVVQPQTEVPPVAVLAAVYDYSFDTSVAQYTDPSYNTLLSSTDLTIDSRKAVAVEIVTTEEMMEPAGTSRYAVLVDWNGDRTFVIETSSVRGDDYTIDKQVVRAMADTLILPD